MTALYRLPAPERARAVAERFVAVQPLQDGRALVKYQGYDRMYEVEVFLVGLGWNPSMSGTSDALVVREPSRRFHLWFIPYTRLVSIEPVK